MSRYIFLLLATLGLVLAAADASLAVQAPHDTAASDHNDAAGHDAAAGHGDHHDDPMAMDPIALDPDLAIWTLVVFGVLLAVLWKFAWGPIALALDQREKSVADNIAAAQRSADEAKAMLAQYEARLSAAAEEVRGILEEARRDAEHTRQEIVAEARQEAEAERGRAVRDVELARDQALKMLAESSADQAVRLAGKIIGAQLQRADHARLIDEAVASFPRANGHG